jgi:hypothetical protein
MFVSTKSWQLSSLPVGMFDSIYKWTTLKVPLLFTTISSFYLRRSDHLSAERVSTPSFKKSVPVMPGVFHNYLVKTFGYRSAKYEAHDSFKTYNYTVIINYFWFEQTFEYFISLIGYYWWANLGDSSIRIRISAYRLSHSVLKISQYVTDDAAFHSHGCEKERRLSFYAV